eukprot:CAMPEP_0179062304 /NCGR_PEP_ID=MMETSP0796-20121207/26860_1 /TAXON_ID=73915 /ORGANISM="Pyrodinium bahamense, Strain pbaha01" /LENGTH=369 /DNA_ID=CAMNT_0020759209 /DNA_START=21 /DNA_END=1130 /DNA_ORIENTATION=+
MAFSVAVYVFEAFTYNVIFLGRILPALGRGALTMPFLVLFNLLWSLAFWSHLQAHLADPGIVPKEWQEFVESLGAAIPIAPSRQEFQPGKATHCRKCNRSRPERAHHCQFCGVCVLRYDHHCPWINNCVGFNNHKFFLLVVLYDCLASVVALATAAPELAHCARVVASLEDRSDLEAKNLAIPAILAFLICGTLALLVTVILTMLLTTYLPFAAQNLTTVEEAYTNMTNPFDLGGINANLEQIFGVFGIDWFIPVKPFRPQTDGVFFPRASERLGPGLLELRDSRPEALEMPLAAPVASRSISRGSAGGGTGQEWTLFGEEDEVSAERLWRLRYHVSPHGTLQARKLEDVATPKSRTWRSCCTRTYHEP